MPARLYKQSKPAGQSGLAGTRCWVLEYGQGAPRRQDSLMGWTGSTDARSQIRLAFDTLDEALAYAKREQIAVEVEKPTERLRRPKVYADNFKSDRIQNWTH
jgi:hypothetical protein